MRNSFALGTSRILFRARHQRSASEGSVTQIPLAPCNSQEFAVHYGMGVVPARPYRPRDKAKVESGVQVCERWIIAALRHRKFFHLAELNQAIRGVRVMQPELYDA